MLSPKRVKHRKVHRGNMSGKSYRGSSVHFGQESLGSRFMDYCSAGLRLLEQLRGGVGRHRMRVHDASYRM